MSETFVTIENVTSRRVLPSFAVGADSEIWVGSINETTGTLIVFERIAKEKGLLGATGETKIGIPLKRHRLPDPVELMSVERLEGVKKGLARLADAGGYWLQDTDLMCLDDDGEEVTIAVFEHEEDADFFATAPGALLDLIEENFELRLWVDKVTRSRRR